MTTVGDRILNKSLPKIGEKSLFTKDLEDALRNGGVDFVVHSLKDLPTSLPDGMAIGAVLKREDPRDALVLNEKYRGKKLTNLPKGSVIGTSSLRRSAQLARDFPHLIVCDIRGNLNTRLAKLDAPTSKFAGLILAHAGLVRMGWDNRVDQILEPSEILYAVGQGALAVECRSNDHDTLEMLSHLSHLDTQVKILTERSFLKTLGGGCSAPVAVCTLLKRKNAKQPRDCHLEVTGAIWSLDGTTKIHEILNCSIEIDDHNEAEVTEIVPRKKIKLSPSISTSNTSSNPSSNFDIESVINIHGEIFKKCPYYIEHMKNRRPNDLDTNSADEEIVCNTNKIDTELKVGDGCPLNIPIGQDFMGQCPFFEGDHNKNDNVDNCEKACKSPVPSIMIHENVDKCPFINAQLAQEAEPSTSLITDPGKCPYLASQKSDELAGSATVTEEINANVLYPEDAALFCGMHNHHETTFKLFRKCQDLGEKLAESLIAKGALEVMRVAQNSIRNE